MNSISILDFNAEEESFTFWIDSGHEPLYQVDLTEFSAGGRSDGIRRQIRWAWAGDYTGRPPLAKEFAAYLRFLQPLKKTCTRWRAAFRCFFRFLDEVDPQKRVTSSADLTDGHGVLLLTWLEQKPNMRNFYTSIKGILSALRSYADRKPLFWPARPEENQAVLPDIDEFAVQRLYEAFKGEGRQIKAMFQEGERLAKAGRDPRGEARCPGTAAWELRENHVWLVKHLTKDFLPTKQEIYAEACGGLMKANDPATQKHEGPEYLAPTMTERGRQGFVGKLRWFQPSYDDTAIFLWLFLIATGWNLSTALAIDVSEKTNWVKPHPQQADTMVLFSFKQRSHSHQFVHSAAAPEWYPYQILRFMIERTRPLRSTLQRRLASLQRELSVESNPKVKAKIRAFEAAIKSPWLYHVVNEIGGVNCFRNEDSGHLNKILRGVVEKHNLTEEFPKLAIYKVSDMRDACLGNSYRRSGYSATIAQLAAQHQNASSLHHYLNRRRYRTYSEEQIRRLQFAAFSEIEARRPIDPARLCLLVQKGTITE